MLGLLTAFFLCYGDAAWGWWVIWFVLEFGELFKFIRKN
jgi:hypothetical protein